MRKSIALALLVLATTGTVAMAEATVVRETFRTSRDMLRAVTVHKPECGMTQAQAREATRGKVRGASEVKFGNEKCGFEFTRAPK